MRIGYFPNINHAQTVIGFGSGNFQNRRHVRWPRPSSKWLWAPQGKDRRIISGVASDATVFVVRSDSGINSPKDFANTIFSSPQLGNRDTIALRKYLQDNGFKTKDNGGNVPLIKQLFLHIIGFLTKGKPRPDLSWIYDLTILNEVLKEKGLQPI